MDFLKDVFGDKALTFDELAAALKDNKEISLGNLAGGAYIGKEKFDAKDRELAAKIKELEEANTLIGDLKKGNEANEDLQEKTSDYETTVAKLQHELEQTKVDAALKVALLEAKALDVDYLTFKIKSGDEEITTDDHGKIKGIDETIEALKKQYPAQFAPSQKRSIDPNNLPGGDDLDHGMSKADLLKKSYAEQTKFFEENPEQYREIMKG